MAEEVELTGPQTEKLLQFQDLTGIEDMDRCRSLLETHNWDIEVAVQDTLNMQEGAPSVFHPPSLSAPAVVTHPHDQRVYSARRSVYPTGLLGWSYFIFSFPILTFRFICSTLFNVVSFALRLVRPDPVRYVTDPLGDVMSFIQEFEAQFGQEHPTFYQGTYSQVLNDAKRELKFLLVYLHSDAHQDTPRFCRCTLSSSEVIQYINTNMLFWACSVRTPEGYRVSQALRENSYPFLAVIVLRDNRMTVVARIEGLMSPPELVQRLGNVMEENETSLVLARAERQERSLTQTIRLQQDEAYQESLLADQEKERKKREELERKERHAQEQRDIEHRAEQLKQAISRRKLELALQIPEEPPATHPDCIRIVIKLPQGTRLERRFLRTDSLKVLYFFVFCHPQSPDSFEIVTNFPRRVIACEPCDDGPEPQTFAEAGLGRSEMLFVHDLEA